MTIAAGFLCRDSVIICADTEHTGEAKFHQTKVRHKNSEILGDYVIAGAGHTTYIGMACDMIEEGIYANRNQISECDQKEQVYLFKEIVRQKVKSIHEHIATYPYEGDRPTVELILGLHSKHNDLLLLHIGMDGGVTTVDSGGVFIGSGAQVALAFSRILWREEMSAELTKYLAFFLLYQAKESAPYCGGATRLAMLPPPKSWAAYDDKQMAEHVEYAMRLSLLYARDTEHTDERLFERHLQQITAQLRAIRADALQSSASGQFVLEELKKRASDKMIMKDKVETKLSPD